MFRLPIRVLSCFGLKIPHLSFPIFIYLESVELVAMCNIHSTIMRKMVLNPMCLHCNTGLILSSVLLTLWEKARLSGVLTLLFWPILFLKSYCLKRLILLRSTYAATRKNSFSVLPTSLHIRKWGKHFPIITATIPTTTQFCSPCITHHKSANRHTPLRTFSRMSKECYLSGCTPFCFTKDLS